MPSRRAPVVATAATVRRQDARIAVLLEQATVALGVTVFAAILSAAGVRFLAAVAVAGLVVFLADGLVAAAIASARRVAACDAIAFATVRPDDPVVRRDRERLRRQATRRGLAAGVERWIAEARTGGAITDGLRSLPLGPVGRARVRAAEAELRAIADRLRDDAPAETRGVALVEWLLSDGCASPLFSGTGEELRAELRRVLYLLDG
jgi:hypothetical protein